jgi:hypothetical protein
MLKTFKDLTVWQKAYQLCLAIYRFTRDYPMGLYVNWRPRYFYRWIWIISEARE